MQIRIGKFDFTEVWDGVFYKKLSDYPRITDWEMRTLIEFIAYERQNDRECTISCDDAALLETVQAGLAQPEKYRNVPRPKLLTECTACPYRRGCETVFVCHTTSPESAAKIFDCGKLLSAVRARKTDAVTLSKESRNAAKDPPDYFDYIMFAWGNCQAGDRLVMERALGRFPDENDLSLRFAPGIRFYFCYEKLAEHPNRVFDGVLPMKIKDELTLSDWVHKIIVPAVHRAYLEPHIPADLKSRVIYVENDCKDIWDWSEKVYRIIEQAE